MVKPQGKYAAPTNWQALQFWLNPATGEMIMVTGIRTINWDGTPIPVAAQRWVGARLVHQLGDA